MSGFNDPFFDGFRQEVERTRRLTTVWMIVVAVISLAMVGLLIYLGVAVVGYINRH